MRQAVLLALIAPLFHVARCARHATGNNHLQLAA